MESLEQINIGHRREQTDNLKSLLASAPIVSTPSSEIAFNGRARAVSSVQTTDCFWEARKVVGADGG
jgi:hypothetical protein